MTLVPYGIQSETTDLRIHVCVAARRVYIYDTDAAMRAIATRRYRTAPAYTGETKTAEGYLVPPDAIPGCRSIAIPADWLAHFSEADSTSVKGDKAMRLVERLARDFGIPVRANLRIVTDTSTQISGIDAVIEQPRRRIQVKCDWHGGRREHGGTGHLYIQIAEANLYQRH